MPVDCQLCLLPGIKTLYFKLKGHLTNALVNSDREFQDELGIDFVLVNATGNKNPKIFKLKIMPHVWEFNGWWTNYMLLTLALAFQQYMSAYTAERDDSKS